MIFNHKPSGYRDFKLSDSFLKQYVDQQPSWGFGDLSYLTFKRTYARDLSNGLTEEFWQCLQRVVEGVYNIQKLHCVHFNLPWDNTKAQRSAQTMFILMWEFKFLPPGRGLAHMGTNHIYERGSAYLQSCGYASTNWIKYNYSEPFCWAMDMSMLGVGVGFDTRGAHTVTIIEPKTSNAIHVIDDTREGWVEIIRILLDAYTSRGTIPTFDYSKIRKKGELLKTIGGRASGPGPLIELVEQLQTLYDRYIDQQVDSTLIVDTFNFIGKCVVSGGIRRTAQISFGEPDDIAFLDLKLDSEALNDRRWCSNNSIFAQIGMDYTEIAKRTAINGEPGYEWLDNSRAYSRMIDPPDHKDYRILGTNPCGEQPLEHLELCCMAEVFLAHHSTMKEYQKTLKYAYLYAKTVTLIPTHSSKTNAVQMRNRRIGLSQSGIQQAIMKFGRRSYFEMCDEGYTYVKNLDRIYSDWLCIPRSIKRTSVKPSGTISLLAGATPGIHFPKAVYYIRRVRIADTSPYIDNLRDAGYVVEEDVVVPNTLVVEFPVHCKLVDRAEKDVTIWEQVKNAVDIQKYWSDNQVSCTVSFQPNEIKDIPKVLEAFETELKGISFAPYTEHGYKQPPYEPITAEEYAIMISRITPLNGLNNVVRDMEDKFCDGEACLMSFENK